MSRARPSLYDLHGEPLAVARIPSLPARAALDALAAADPIEATKRCYREDPFARAALAVASPSLARAVAEWIDGQPVKNAKTPLRALSYLIRMATRPTPFGLCAGIAAVEIGENTTLSLDERATARRTFTRPDMMLLNQLVEAVEQSELREGLAFVTNDCAFVRGNRLYVANIALTNYHPKGSIARAEQREVSLKHTPAVALVRELCARPERYERIVAALCERFGASNDESKRLLDRLIAAGVVISELRPSPLGDPAALVLERLEALGASKAPELRAAAEAANRLDRMPLSERGEAAYLGVHEAFASLVEPAAAGAVQIDLRHVLSGTLGRAVLDDAAIVADSYVRMGRVMLLQTFRDRFLERYEGSERMVPLLELVDASVGLGVTDRTSFEERDASERDAFVMRAACEAMRTNAEELCLEGELLERFLPPLEDGEPVPRSLEIGFQLAARSREDVEKGEDLLVAGFTGDAGLKSLGRFAHLLGDEFIASMRGVARRACADGEATAEFVYAPPDARAYNVSIRPSLFDYEIRAGVGAPVVEGAISPADLWVGIQNDRFFLWSESLQRRVSVRETHAFMTATNAPNLCRFLALLHADGKRFPGVNWGPAEELTYLPRLRRGRVVLAPRRWRFERSAFGASESDAARELGRARALWNMPRYVYLCEEDNRLLLDLDSPVAAALFADQAPETLVRIEEAIPVPDTAWLRGERGAHVAEFVVQAAAAAPAPVAPRAEPLLVPDRRVYGPGSPWVYTKLYLGAQAVDDFIASALAPLAADLRERGAIDRWFFVRYADPQHHVRLRFRATGADGDALRRSVATAAERWLRDARIARYAFETYDPEYERYGGVERIDAAERFFTYDSDVCAAVLAEGIGDTGARVEAAAATFDALLRADGDLGRLALETFEPTSKPKLSPRDRESLRRIGDSPVPPWDVAPLVDALDGPRRHKRLADLVHMHCNRLGLEAEAERRVGLLLRSLALARVARAKAPAAATPVTS